MTLPDAVANLAIGFAVLIMLAVCCAVVAWRGKG